MYSSSMPPEFYQEQAELAAQELDFDLSLAAETTGEPIEQSADSQIYQFNAILDAINDD